MKKVLSLWVAMGLLILSGCQSLAGLESPEVSVSGINLNSFSPVSYTHLTLPTIYSV